MLRLIFSISVLFFCSFTFLFAQTQVKNKLKFEKLSLAEGLSQSSANAIVQDAFGFIWIATQDGLNRYDGYTFKIFRHSRKDTFSILDNHIKTLFIDSENLLWCGTDKAGISCFDQKTQKFTNYQNNRADKNAISNGQVNAITADLAGNIWIGTSYGLNVFDKKSKKFRHYFSEKNKIHSILSNSINALEHDKKGNIWIGTPNGVTLYSAEKKQFDSIPFAAAASRSTSSIYIDNLNIVWIGMTDGRLCKYDEAQNAIVEMPDLKFTSNITDLFEDERGHLWIVLTAGEIVRYHFSTKVIDIFNPDLQNHIAGGQFLSGFIDKSGVIWFGSESEGILKYDDQKERFRTYTPQPNAESSKANVVWIAYKDKEKNIWTGTEDGVFKLAKDKTQFERILPERLDLRRNSSFATFFQFEGEDDIAISLVGRGFWKIPKKGKDLLGVYDTLSMNQTTYSVIKDKKGYYWAAASNCIARIKVDEKTKERTYKYYFRKGKRFTRQNSISIHEDKNGDFWFATTDSGLVQAKRNAQNELESFTYYSSVESDDNTLSNSFIFHSAIDPDGKTIWVATANGLNKFDIETKKNIRLGEKYEQANLPLYGILIDETGNLWMSSNVGILKFDPKTEAFNIFTMRDGLQSNEFNQYSFYKAPDGEMFFGGIKGLNSFYPKDFSPNPILPKVVITDFKILNQKVEIGENSPLKIDISSTEYIELSHEQNNFSFEFVGLSYRLSEKNQYAFIMEGYEKDWNYVGSRRFANYTNLPAGDYIFRVKAANNDGLWNMEGASIRVRIKPPFWKTWGFIISLTVLILGIGYFLYKQRIAIIQKQKEELERQVLERTVLIQEQKEELVKTLDLVSSQKEKIEVLNEDFISSLNAAVRIQEATLPFFIRLDRQIGQGLYFVFYKPRDIVSGDFYWFDVIDDTQIMIVADCTGHGVPGAFMSMIGMNLLEDFVKSKKIVEPAKILEQMNKGVRYALGQDQNSEIPEGMDMIVLSRKANEKIVKYAGAMLPIYYVQNHELFELKATKKSVGGTDYRVNLAYEQHEVSIESSTTFYLATDGYKDQFGGPNHKKFMASNLKKLFLSIENRPMNEQKESLNHHFEDWINQSTEMQIDDVTVLGWKINP